MGVPFLSSSDRVHPVVYSELIQQLSQKLTADAALADKARFTVRAVRDLLGSSRVVAVLRTARGSSPITAEITAAGDSKRAAFVFSRPLSVRGIDYGQFEVEFHRPVASPQIVFQTLETVTTLLALAVEEHHVEEQHARVASEAESARAELANSKILSRAVGLVADTLHLETEDALDWIRHKAERTHKSVVQTATEVVDREMSRRRRLELPVGRTA